MKKDSGKKKAPSAKRIAPSQKGLVETFQRGLKVKIKPFGPDQSAIDTLASELLQHASLQKVLGKAQSRLLSIELIDPEPETKSNRSPNPPDRFKATIYDYTNNRTITAVGSLASRGRLEISESIRQPLPSHEEFEEAVKILAKEADVASALSEKHLRPYPPMPPLIEAEQPDGRPERTIAVGLLPTNHEASHEIVGVNLGRQNVVRFERKAPANAVAHNPICGLPYAGQNTAGKGTAGQVWVTVSQGGTTLWRFLAVRPAASSGTNGSGVELRYVDYRGKRVLYRAHVPILNVKYENDVCGPYRDWQYEEGMIQATGADVGSGFRLCPFPAQTILDTGSDAGNFLGVGIYVQGQEVVLVSEMEAGWYRYVSEWRLHTNGTIRPRFGFSAVQSSCVCTTHHHHVYWRFDFDIRTAGNNIVREFNNPCLPGTCPSKWHNKDFEIRRFRAPARKRKWRVQNAATGEAYDVIPGPDDGVATATPDWPFPRGDVWILRYRGGAEIDDGVVATGPPFEAGLDGFVTGDSVKNQDVVIWYGAHFTHDITAEPPGSHGHIVGPDLKPVNW
jgi:hypothetical protein